MLMHDDSTNDSSILVPELLEDIWKITIKIKKELNIINDLVRENGDFNTAIEQANQILLKVIKEKQLDLDSSGTDKDDNENDSDSDNNVSDKNVADTSKKKNKSI